MKQQQPWWRSWILPLLLLLVAYVGIQEWISTKLPPPFSYSEFRETVG